MNFLFYTHSLVSDWNHGNAHFLRGVMTELRDLGHRVRSLEPENGWSRANLEREQGREPLERFASEFPHLHPETYGPSFEHEAALDNADVVVVHEWTDPELVARIGLHRRRGGRFLLGFHDTHHRIVSAPAEMDALRLGDYDIILAFGETLREIYARRGWGRRAVTWHEAADTRLFRPREEVVQERDLVWIGNWGDGERAAELEEFLLGPASRLSLDGRIHGVRYPPQALDRIRSAGLDYRGWIANAAVPTAFAQARVTVHVPRAWYVKALPGIPTIRVFEALACGIPLVSAPWHDSENLFSPGDDFLVAEDGEAMEACLRDVLCDHALAASLREKGLATIRARHSCRHRALELLATIGRFSNSAAHSKREAAL